MTESSTGDHKWRSRFHSSGSGVLFPYCLSGGSGRRGVSPVAYDYFRLLRRRVAPSRAGAQVSRGPVVTPRRCLAKRDVVCEGGAPR